MLFDRKGFVYWKIPDWIKIEFSIYAFSFGSLLTKSSDLSNLQTPVLCRLYLQFSFRYFKADIWFSSQDTDNVIHIFKFEIIPVIICD